jgi:RiboL-PSP-HEPN
MPTFVDTVHTHFDLRIRTLAGIKARSLGADNLTLTALKVLIYAQLEGGIKDLASCVLNDVNALRLPFGRINPAMLLWRNPNEIDRLKAMVDFNMVALANPFTAALNIPFQLRSINRKYELNQMSSDAVLKVYTGFGLDPAEVIKLKTKIDEIVEDRNQAAHYGVLPRLSTGLMEQHIRDNVMVVENLLTDFSIQLLPFFTDGRHLR